MVHFMNNRNKGIKNPSYIDGRTLKTYYCIDCSKKVSGYRSKLCRSCSTKKRYKNPKNHPRYKNGKHANNKICINCGRKISRAATYCRSCATKIQVKIPQNHPSWKGGIIHSRGYVYIYSPNHPRINNSYYIAEHRLVMEKYIGRYLKPEEVVHHINGIRTDNRIENLMLFPNHREHRLFHHKFLKYVLLNFPNILNDYIKMIKKDNVLAGVLPE